MSSQNEMLRELHRKARRMEHLENRLNQLYEARTDMECTVHDLQLADDKEQADVRQLEGKTFAAFFYGLVGQKDDRLSKEQAEALASRARLETAEQELLAISREIADYEEELASLTGCDARYAALLQEKRDAVAASGKPEAAELLRLEEEITAAEQRLNEIREALAAGKAAKDAAKQVLSELDSAEEWGAFDAFGGGLVAGIAKHSHLDSAQEKLWYMRQNIEKFRTELADVDIHADLQVNVDGFAQFADIFFDDFFTDWSVLDRISNSKSQVRRVMEQVEGVMRRLRETKQDAKAAAERLTAERDELIINIEV